MHCLPISFTCRQSTQVTEGILAYFTDKCDFIQRCFIQTSGSFACRGFACGTSSICKPGEVQNVAYFLLALTVGNM